MIEHVYVDMQDGEGEVVAHALTAPADAGEGKRNVQLPNGRIVEDLERHEKGDGRRGWREA